MSDIKNYQMLINGNWVDASDGGTFDSVNPTTGEIWSRIPEATEADVNLAVETAHHSFTKGPWSKLTPTERGKCLRKLGDLLAEQSESLGRTESIDTGKMLKETRCSSSCAMELAAIFGGR
jgi:acyl-CoA reductase-like NAD-dependent aldehyde dehydrogenase